MTSFSNLSKTYAKDKLSKCTTTVLLVCCYLYRKRSNIININAEAKKQSRDMQTPVDDSIIFTEVSRSTQAPPSPRWSPSQRPSSWSGNSMDSLGPSHAQVGLRRAFRQASPRSSPLSSLSNFRLKRNGPCFLQYTAATTPQMRLV